MNQRNERNIGNTCTHSQAHTRTYKHTHTHTHTHTLKGMWHISLEIFNSHIQCKMESSSLCYTVWKVNCWQHYHATIWTKTKLATLTGHRHAYICCTYPSLKICMYLKDITVTTHLPFHTLNCNSCYFWAISPVQKTLYCLPLSFKERKFNYVHNIMIMTPVIKLVSDILLWYFK